MNSSLIKADRLYVNNLKFNGIYTYLLIMLFITGNVVFPYAVHSIPNGGQRFLAIYFFVLISSYKFGFRTGILTALLSPVINHYLTGMPHVQILSLVMVKGLIIASCASFVAVKTSRISILILGLVICLYQIIGFIFEYVYYGDYTIAAQHIFTSIPGMLIQLFGGYLIIKSMRNYGKKNIK